MDTRQAIDGFILFKSGQGASPKTMGDYGHWLRLFVGRYGDRDIASIKSADISAFLDWLRHDYKPRRLSGDDRPLSSQSVRNAWVALKSFNRWAMATLGIDDVMGGGRVPMPKASNQLRQPYTQAEIKALLAAITPRRAPRATSGKHYLKDLRDRAIVLTLLDTGARASELCGLDIGDLHLKTGRITIVSGKGGKSRHVWVGDVTRPALWQYIQERPDGSDPARPLFISYGTSPDGQPLRPNSLNDMLTMLGQKAGVEDCHAHRFRYTFCLAYLRNGGDIFTLQALLGHTSMTMVQHYLKLASADVENAHRRNSPVDRWLK